MYNPAILNHQLGLLFVMNAMCIQKFEIKYNVQKYISVPKRGSVPAERVILPKQPNLFLTIQNPDLSGFQIPTVHLKECS